MDRYRRVLRVLMSEALSGRAPPDTVRTVHGRFDRLYDMVCQGTLNVTATDRDIADEQP